MMKRNLTATTSTKTTAMMSSRLLTLFTSVVSVALSNGTCEIQERISDLVGAFSHSDGVSKDHEGTEQRIDNLGNFYSLGQAEKNQQPITRVKLLLLSEEVPPKSLQMHKSHRAHFMRKLSGLLSGFAPEFAHVWAAAAHRDLGCAEALAFKRSPGESKQNKLASICSNPIL